MEAFTDALSWLVETWKTSITVKDVANSRCLVDMYIQSAANVGALAVGSYHILREASACLLVLLRWAIPEPLIAGRATSTALTLSFY